MPGVEGSLDGLARLPPIRALAEHPGKLVTRDELYRLLWKGNAADYAKAPDTTVTLLRRVLA